MDEDKISSIKKEKRSWFGKDRKTSFRSCNPNDRYFNARIKEVQETFLNESSKYLEQHDPGLLYNIKNKLLPKKQKKTIIKTSREDNELDKYQKEREQKRKEELVKRTQISVVGLAKIVKLVLYLAYPMIGTSMESLKKFRKLF